MEANSSTQYYREEVTEFSVSSVDAAVILSDSCGNRQTNRDKVSKRVNE